MIDKNLYIKYFANCIPVKGSKRAIICDLQRSNFEFVPIDLIEILEENATKTIAEIETIYGEENFETIKEYIDFLLEKEFIFLCNKHELDLFPKMDLRWDYPAHITNALIDSEKSSTMNYAEIFQQLEDLGCAHIQLRFFYGIELNTIKNIMELLEESSIESVSIIAKYNQDYDIFQYVDIKMTYARITEFRLYGYDKEYTPPENTNLRIDIIDVNTLDKYHCGVVIPLYFSVNIPHFTESQQHNTCLNRKISIDANGDIKNCPSMTKSYGNITNTTLKEAIEKTGFKDVWYIHKEQIKTCQDCEFRHICTDCRAYVENPLDKPFKCNYNPYTAEWSNE